MKEIRRRTISGIAGALTLLPWLFAPDRAGAQEIAPPAFSNLNYIGELDASDVKLHVALHLRRDSSGIRGTADSPDQNAYGLRLAEIQDQDDTLRFDVPEVGGHFAGKWSLTRTQIAGTWSQDGKDVPLVLTQGGYPAPLALQWDQPVAAGFQYTPATVARPSVGPAYRLGKCINMSNMLDAPKEGAWGPAIAEDDFKIIRAAGFTTVRLPVAWSVHAGLESPYAIDPGFLKRVHHVVDLATASNLTVLLDFHHFAAFNEDPVGQQARFVALWNQIARSFADAPDSVWFELLNEPHDKLGNTNLPGLYAPALRAIRTTNPRRLVVVGAEWNNLDKLIAFDLPDDPNIVPSFHYYDPFLFTHQGASFTQPTPAIGRAFGSAEDKAELDATLAKAQTYMRKSGRVPFVGEYGAQDDPRVPLAQRLRYYGIVSSAFASIGLDSCVWGYRSGFRIREGKKWVPGMVDAIQETRPR